MRTICTFFFSFMFLSIVTGQIESIHEFTNSYSIYPSNLLSSNSKLILGANRYIGNSNPFPELWLIDFETTEVKILPKPNSSFVMRNLGLIDGNLMFKGTDHQLWRIDLETLNSVLVSNGFYTDNQKQPIPLNDKLIYQGTFATDGTPGGTFELFNGNFDYRATIENQLILLISQTGKLWRTDGTQNGTVQYANVEGGISRMVRGQDFHFIQTESSLWITDGTANGTNPILNLTESGFTELSIHKGGSIGNLRLFEARTMTFGTELWISDGTYDGTTLLKDITPGISSSVLNNFFTINDTVYFTVLNENHKLDLWKSDGTPEGTSLRLKIGEEFQIKGFQKTKNFKNWILFNATVVGDRKVLIFFNGEKFKLIDERVGNAFFIGDLYNFSQVHTDNYYYFLADDGQYGQEVWQVDSLGQLKMLGDLSPGTRWTLPRLIGGTQEYFSFIARQRKQDPYTLFRFKENSSVDLPVYPTKYEWFQSISNTTPWYSDLAVNTCENSRLKLDKSNNIYTMGVTRVPTSIAFFQDTIIYEDLSQKGAYYIGKIKPDGKAEWLKVFKHRLAKPDQALHVDNEQNILLGARFEGPDSDSTAILVKMAPDGTTIWTKEFNFGYHARITQIISDKDGNFYMTGTATTGLRYFDDEALEVERTGYFLSKFDKNGQALWAEYISKDTSWEELNSLVGLSIDENNNIYFGLDNLYRYYAYHNDCDEPMPTEIKFFSYTENGSKRWEKKITSDDIAYIADIEVSPNDEVYLLGYFRNNLKFPEPIITTNQPCQKGQFLLKFDLDGNLFDTSAQFTEILFPLDLEFDDCGNFYTAGIRQMASEAASFFYPGYFQYPFERGYRQNYVYKYDYNNNQIEGRTFNKRKEDHFATQLAIMDDQVILQGNYSFILDTIPESSSYVETNKTFLLNFKFESGCTTYPGDGPSEFESDLYLVPNPTSDNLMVYTKEKPENAQIQIFNSLGQTISVNTIEMDKGIWLNTSVLNQSGIYYIQVQIGDKILTGSFIKH